MNEEWMLAKAIKPVQETTGLLRFLTSTKAVLVLLPLGLAVWGIWIVPQLNILPTIVIDSNTPYLLSAIAQSLATVLALVFTISLIAVQLSSRYSYRPLAEFFDAFTIAYMLLFITAVILPFYLLASPSLNGLKLSIVLAAVCLVLLVPYFLGFRQKLSPEHMLLNLKKSALKQLLANPETEPASVITIDNTIMSAFALKDYDTLGKGVEVLADLAYEAGKRKSGGLASECIRSLYARLENIALVTIEDPRVPKQVVKEFVRLGKGAIDRRLEDETWGIVSHLGELSLNAVDKSLRYTAGFIVSDLFFVGRDTVHSGMCSACGRAIITLGNIGLRSLNKDWGQFVRYVVAYLLQIGVELKEAEPRHEGKFVDEMNTVAYWLVRLGACALHKKDTALSTEIADALKDLHSITHIDIPSILRIARMDVSPEYEEYYTATNEDLLEFAKLLQWHEDNNSVEQQKQTPETPH